MADPGPSGDLLSRRKRWSKSSLLSGGRDGGREKAASRADLGFYSPPPNSHSMTEQVPSTSSTTLPAAAVAANHAAVKAAIAKSQTAVSDLSTSPTSKEAVPATTLDAGLLDPRPNLTVFSSATEFTVKHPLYSNWQLWFDSASRQDKAKHWDDALIKVVEVDSVEEFWG